MTTLIRLLNLRYLRRQPLRSLLVVLGVAGGVSLSVGVLVTAASTTASIRTFGHQIAGLAPIRVMGPDTHGGVTPAMLAAVQSTPGVGSAVPVVQTVVQVTTASGRAVDVAAIGTAVGSAGGTGGSLVADDTPPMISRRLASELGPAPTLWTDVGPIRLASASGSAALDAVDAGRAVIFPLAQAQRIFDRPGRFDAVYITPAAGVTVSTLRARLSDTLDPSADVQLSTDPPGDYVRVVSFLTPLLGLLSLATLAAAAALIFNIMALSLEERSRELAVASAIGAKARFVVLGTVTEAAVLGGLGGVIGTGLGFLVARPMVGTLSSQSQKVAGVVSRVHVTTQPIVAGVAIGLVVGAASSWVPARRATRLDIVSELQQRGGASDGPQRVRVRRALIWTGVAAVGLVASIVASMNGSLHPWQLIVGDVGIAAASIGGIVGVGAWAPVVIAAAERAVAHARWASRLRTLPLALVNLTRQPKRTGAMALAIAGAVGMAAALSNAVPSMNVGVGRAFAAYAAGRIDVTTLSVNNSGTIDSKVPPSVEAAIIRIPGVAAVDLGSFTDVNDHGSSLAVSDGVGDSAYPVLRGVDSRVAFAQGEIMVGAGLARSKHLSPGSVLPIPTLGGVTALRVGGIWQDPNNMGTAVSVGPGVITKLFGAQPPGELFVRVAPGASLTDVAERIRDAWLDPRLRVYTPTQYGAELAREIRGFLNPFWVMQRVWLAVALIAVLASLLLIGIQRRREHGILAAVGMGPRLLGRLTLVEGAVIGLTGSVLGLLSSVLIEASFTRVAGILFGLSVPVRLAIPPSLLYALIGTLVVLVGASLPAWRSSRLEVVEALRYE